MSNNLAVKVSADVADLTSKFAIAKASVNALSSELNNLAKQSISGMVGPTDLGRMEQLAGDLTAAKSAAAGYSEQIKAASGSTRELGGSLSDIRGQLAGAFELTGVGVAIEGIRKLGEVVEEFGDRATELRSQSMVLGVTVEQLQAMQLAAEDTGVSEQIMVRATETLVKTLDEARGGSGAAIEKLRELGVSTGDIADKSFGAVGMIQALNARLADGSTHAAEMAALTEILGSKAVLAAAAFAKLDLSAKGVSDAMSEVGGLSSAQAQKVSEMGIAVKTVGTAIENAGPKLLLFLKDVVTMGPAMAGATNELGAMAANIERAKVAQAEADAARSGQIQRALTDYQLEQGAAILSANAITKADMDSIKERIAGEAQGSAARLALVRQFYQESLQFYGSGDVDKVREAHSQLLEETREYNSKQEQLSTQLMHGLEGDINHQIEDMKKVQEQFKKNAEESRKTEDAELEATRDSVIGQIALQKQLVESSAGGSGKNATAQSLAAEIALTVQELEAWENYYQAKMALAQGDAAAMATLQAQRYATEQKFNTQVIKLEADSAKDTQAQWMTALKPIGSAFDTMVSGMIRGTTTMRQSMTRLGGSLVDDMIKSTTQMLEKWIAKELAQTSATLTGNTVRTTSTISANAAAKSASAATGSSTVMADAAKAFSGTYASVAQIPYVGWILAPAAATAAYVAVAAYEGMASLAVGTAYVPQDMPAMLHQGEAVLPKPMAQSMRDGQFGGGGNYSEEHNYGNVTIPAIDGASLKRVLRNRSNQKELAGAARQYLRRGGR